MHPKPVEKSIKICDDLNQPVTHTTKQFPMEVLLYNFTSLRSHFNEICQNKEENMIAISILCLL